MKTETKHTPTPDPAVQMLQHLESWLRDSFFAKDEAHCLQKAYEVAQAIAAAEARHD